MFACEFVYCRMRSVVDVKLDVNLAKSPAQPLGVGRDMKVDEVARAFVLSVTNATGSILSLATPR